MNRSGKRNIIVLVSLAVIFVCLSSPVEAGLLDAFESDKPTNGKPHPPKKHKPSKKEPGHKAGGKKNKSHGSNMADDVASERVGFGGQYLFFAVAAGGIMSYERAYLNMYNPEDTDGRQYGDPLIPFARADISYRHVNSDISALDYRLEGGFGPLALELSHSMYDEKLTDGTEDEMDMMRISGLYRMTFGTLFEVDLGLGSLTIDGNEKNSGFSFSTPILFHFSEYMGIEFRPAWATVNGAQTRDYDIAMLFTWRNASIKTGVRSVKAGNMTLEGPYGGISIHF